jgi:hypothetical protein
MDVWSFALAEGRDKGGAGEGAVVAGGFPSRRGISAAPLKAGGSDEHAPGVRSSTVCHSAQGRIIHPSVASFV